MVRNLVPVVFEDGVHLFGRTSSAPILYISDLSPENIARLDAAPVNTLAIVNKNVNSSIRTDTDVYGLPPKVNAVWVKKAVGSGIDKWENFVRNYIVTNTTVINQIGQTTTTPPLGDSYHARGEVVLTDSSWIPICDAENPRKSSVAINEGQSSDPSKFTAPAGEWAPGNVSDFLIDFSVNDDEGGFGFTTFATIDPISHKASSLLIQKYGHLPASNYSLEEDMVSVGSIMVNGVLKVALKRGTSFADGVSGDVKVSWVRVANI